MKTKFILNGGFNPETPENENLEFYREILKDAQSGVRILLVPFARETDRYESGIARISGRFNKVKGEKDIFIVGATRDDLISEIKKSDIIYFHGGQTLRLLEILKNYPDLGDAISGKVVAGESAGANVWGKYFYSKNAGVVGEGLGILPIKIMPHYKKEFEGKLDNVGHDLELLTLPEYEFKVFYK